MLIIHPEECIDCGVCEPECPVEAIKPDTGPGPMAQTQRPLSKNLAKYYGQAEPPAYLKEWEGKPDKLKYFSAKSGRR